MKNKVIDSILSAETEAEKIVLEAKEQSSKMIFEAENKKEQTKNNINETSKQLLKAQTVEFENSAKLTYENSLKEYSEQAEKVFYSAKNNFPKAVEILLKKI